MSLLPCLEIEPQSPANASIIWLHGLGADGYDFEPITKELELADSIAMRFVFPHAPTMPVTINEGAVMPAWYDVLSMAINERVDIEGIQASSAKIRLLIDHEIERGIASQRIIIAGFSQGGAVAYDCALSYPQKLGGLMALSSYFATHKEIQYSPANSSIPIHIFHGIADPIVPEILGQRAVKRLKDKGFKPKYKTYPIQHNVCVEEIDDISMWLNKVLAT